MEASDNHKTRGKRRKSIGTMLALISMEGEQI
jgi:hypothetical protein